MRKYTKHKRTRISAHDSGQIGIAEKITSILPNGHFGVHLIVLQMNLHAKKHH
ncbi:hypothetical protein ETAE_2676 [Edwardsiella piscicida]|uniref:Uncharacterized protein n=1 Tax=Edwardsiella piscicida TaxID=1263550 RepID=A0AAU8P773_EDWPI|nr:hypothetical protein ETAE_2676 [Edwardsiella tarda EIB202]